MPLSTGQLLNNRYRIVRLLGQGGFGAVYRAWDTSLNIPVAIKENLDVSAQAARQFALEANLLGTLRHPNLPKVTDHFSLPNQGQYLVMEYIDGEDLTEKVKNIGGPLPERDALSWGDQILDAVIFLHHQNPPIIHRDIKPDNIRITPQSQAVLVDFGIAKVFVSGRRTTLAARAVTPGYSPFESYGQGSTDERSDLYALGATLYFALTGFDPPDSVDRMMGKPIVPIRQINPMVSLQVEAAIMKAMELQPQNRFSTAQEFRSALHEQPSQKAASQVLFTTSSLQSTTYVPPAQPAGVIAYNQAASSQVIPSSSSRLLWIVAGVVIAAILLLAAAGFLWATYSQAPLTTSDGQAVVVYPTTEATATQEATVEPQVGPPTLQPPSDTPVPPSVSPPTRPVTKMSTHTPLPPPTEAQPSGPIMLQLDSGYHCRGGPDESYELLRDLNAGQQLEIIGISPDRGWYLVRLQDPSTRKKLCWVTGGVVQGDLASLPVCTWTGDGYTENPSCSP